MMCAPVHVSLDVEEVQIQRKLLSTFRRYLRVYLKSLEREASENWDEIRIWQEQLIRPSSKGDAATSDDEMSKEEPEEEEVLNVANPFELVERGRDWGPLRAGGIRTSWWN